MKHIKGMTVIANPLINSYKRLVPGYEAPLYIAWSATNRSLLIRIPASRGENTRIELRSPDPTANPYMLFAVCLAAGLDGIKNNLIPEESIDNNIFEMSEKERKELGIDKLPENLNDAIDEFEKDELMKSVLGEDISSNYINVWHIGHRLLNGRLNSICINSNVTINSRLKSNNKSNSVTGDGKYDRRNSDISKTVRCTRNKKSSSQKWLQSCGSMHIGFTGNVNNGQP
jgi:hypothetical protein